MTSNKLRLYNGEFIAAGGQVRVCPVLQPLSGLPSLTYIPGHK